MTKSFSAAVVRSAKAAPRSLAVSPPGPSMRSSSAALEGGQARGLVARGKLFKCGAAATCLALLRLPALSHPTGVLAAVAGLVWAAIGSVRMGARTWNDVQDFFCGFCREAVL